jgi:hypothetical protein
VTADVQWFELQIAMLFPFCFQPGWSRLLSMVGVSGGHCYGMQKEREKDRQTELYSQFMAVTSAIEEQPQELFGYLLPCMPVLPAYSSPERPSTQHL